MFSYITSFFNYLFSKESDNEDDDDEAAFLAEQLLKLELEEKKRCHEFDLQNQVFDVTKPQSCFSRTGIITYLNSDNNYVLIDDSIYYDTSACSVNLNVKDRVLYLGSYKADGSLSVIRILQNQGSFWGDENDVEEVSFSHAEHTLLGQVADRDGRYVHMMSNDLKFSLDDVAGTFIPVKGDLLEMTCTVKVDDDNPTDISAAEVLEVKSFRPLGEKIVCAKITKWNGEYGTCENKIYFDRHCLPGGWEPDIGLRLMLKTIESCQGKCTRRAIQLDITTDRTENIQSEQDIEESSLQLEKDLNLQITHPLCFDKVELNETSEISLEITNNSNQIQFINKLIVLSKKRDSQINITPVLNRPYRLYIGKSFTFTIKCIPKFLGKAKEQIIIMFQGFKITRVININVINAEHRSFEDRHSFGNSKKIDACYIDSMRAFRDKKRPTVNGQVPTRSINFIAVRLGTFPIPDQIWSIVLRDADCATQNYENTLVLDELINKFPFFNKNLSIYNYLDRWHTLLYLEEIQQTIEMRAFDIEKTYLDRYQEYFKLEVNGLSEKRPSLVHGDKVIVKYIWDDQSPKYEGYIYEVKGQCILIKFNVAFHETYSGSDVSVQFHFGRTPYRKCHQALNMAISNLGPEVLFPSKISKRPPQVPPESLGSIKWFNKNLNHCQVTAVTNILLGECRPLPYVIYGPPGTGKTVTVVETILQILTNIPHSRILVATPSNSAANMITDRLVDYKDQIQQSFVRVIAHYLIDSDTIPERIRRYCVTLNIATEGSSKSINQFQNGINVNCQSNFIGRHRITIGTCSILGSLTQMAFPKGHFTHVIVDEAGQTTEPEIMIPLTLTDKENGQLIIAGDPMQLGPIIKSSFCLEFGMDETYLTRILETYPYQKDYAAFQTGFNEKLVTRLSDNYRSLKEVLTLPSEMFYDGILEEKLNRNQPWIKRLVDIVSELFEAGESKAGGIYVHGVRGHNTRAEDSPSWYNPQEATMVALTICKLYKKHVPATDIGIITPYLAQNKYIRSLFRGMGLPLPKIGTVEEFQGQEKRLIIISTVRSSEALVAEDMKNSLGFVKCPKRLNVAITRAQVAMLLFCDPHLLSTDPLWLRVIAQAVKEDKYMGCDLPNVLNLNRVSHT